LIPELYDGIPIAVPCVDKLKGWFDEIFSDPPLGYQIHDGHQQKWFVGGAVMGMGRISIPILIGSQAGKLF